MKNLLVIFLILFFPRQSHSQEVEYQEYSYTEFFNLIEKEQDTVFQLSDAFILFNSQTDSLFTKAGQRKDQLVIDKKIVLNNVHFQFPNVPERAGAIYNVLFKRDVDIDESISAYFINCVFEGYFHSNNTSQLLAADKLASEYGNLFYLADSKFHRGLEIAFNDGDSERRETQIGLWNNEIWSEPIFDKMNMPFTVNVVNMRNAFSVYGDNIVAITMKDNVFHTRTPVMIRSNKTEAVTIHRNNFDESFVRLSLEESGQLALEIEDNTFNNAVLFDTDKLDPSYIIQWKQLNNKIISRGSWAWFDPEHEGHSLWAEKYANPSDSLVEAFHNSFKIENTKWFNEEIRLLGSFYDYYQSKYLKEDANLVYIEMKDMETERLKYLNKLDPTFDNFFTLKINQFLKVFSAYGTRPANAIIYSMYVILIFAFVYLFFPNSWDSHGKNRIINRYKFFAKYMSKDAGIHEVYQDEKKEEMLSYEQFKNIMQSYENKIPKFFTATAFPLYKWAVSGTKLTSAFLRRIDIIQGTWSELPTSKRWWKGLLLIGAFTIAIAYDIIIKMLNALMLSINTFTTLGFGEIPIKGLPRYLAIIQGFIGWFMLTIFSVSLISQLLN